MSENCIHETKGKEEEHVVRQYYGENNLLKSFSNFQRNRKEFCLEFWKTRGWVQICIFESRKVQYGFSTKAVVHRRKCLQ